MKNLLKGVFILIFNISFSQQLELKSLETVGIDSNRFQRVLNELDNLSNEKKLPGTVTLIIKDNKVILNQANGFKDLEKEIEELNQAGMKLEELKAKQLEVMADRENLTMLEFKEKYGVSIGGQRRFANKISDDLQVARQELEQEQEDVMTQRQIEQAATIRYQDTSSSDNSTNIQYIQASKYELSPKR